MKSINKKPLIIVGGIFLVIFLIIIFVAIFRSCGRPGSNYEKVEDKMIKAANKYFNSDNADLPDEFEYEKVDVEELASHDYMKGLTKYLDDVSCTGYVTVYNYGGQYLYIPDLNCTDYKTRHLAAKIIDDNLVENPLSKDEMSSSGDYVSGLYDIDGTYVFRGKGPNNYISFGGLMWRIIDINDEGIIRVIKSEPEDKNIYWDTKFNAEIGKANGINDYKNSFVLESMNTEYAGFKNESKLHMAPYSVCIGKRDANQLDIDRKIDCSEVLDNQYIGLVSSADFALASLDSSCDKITSGACTNYNYMLNTVGETWTSTALTRNSYEVIYINGGIANAMNARMTAGYSWVIAFNGDEKYISGDGTKEKPYVVGIVK